jgi:ABC-2 type transport system ATP-binding protein
MKDALELRDLTKVYGSLTALDGVSLSVPPGSVVGVIGPNGAGKSTTMRLILGLIRPSGGTAIVLGTESWRSGPSLRRRVGYLPGDLKLDGGTTGHDTLRYFGLISGPVDERFRNELVERLEFDPSRRVRTLSKGNRQKLGLVQALMHRPELLVLDEPTSGLDPLMQREFIALMREAKAAGQAVFLSSHVISEVQHCADHVAVIRQGHLVRSARVAELRDEAPRSVRLELDAPLTAGQAEALRQAGLTFRAADNPPGPLHPAGAVTVVEGQVSGSPVALLGVLSRLGLVDVVIEEPDLEQAVLGLYAQAAPGMEVGRHGR